MSRSFPSVRPLHCSLCLSPVLSLPAPPLMSSPLLRQLSEVEVNGQIEQVCEQVYSEMQSQAMEAAMDSMDTMDTLPMPGCFRMRSHSYVRAIDQGCAGEEEGEGGRPLLLLPSSPPRTSATTVRTIQSSTGRALQGRNGCSV